MFCLLTFGFLYDGPILGSVLYLEGLFIAPYNRIVFCFMRRVMAEGIEEGRQPPFMPGPHLSKSRADGGAVQKSRQLCVWRTAVGLSANYHRTLLPSPHVSHPDGNKNTRHGELAPLGKCNCSAAPSDFQLWRLKHQLLRKILHLMNPFEKSSKNSRPSRTHFYEFEDFERICIITFEDLLCTFLDPFTLHLQFAIPFFLPLLSFFLLDFLKSDHVFGRFT